MVPTYDFIVVGSGPAGSSIASSLARSAAKPQVLLVEAGGPNDDRNMRVDGQRWTTFQNTAMNWGYKTAPQEHCAGRELDYSRGRGLGGSSAINFSVFSVGARRDYDEWASLVGDSAFAWEHMRRRFKSLEAFDPTPPPGVSEKYAAPRPDDHGTDGPLRTGFPAEAEKDVVPMFELFEEAGFPLNPDHNSGNPIGFALGINSSSKGLRSTATDMLTPTPENLTIVTESPVQRIVLEGKRAVGVESNGKQYLATKEVVLSAGALDDPKILMHSGIGPRAQLEKFGIPVVRDVPAIGQGLRDHAFVPLAYARASGDADRAAFYGDEAAMASALARWEADGTGPWAKYGCEMPIGWFKLPGLVASPEFRALPESEKAFLNDPTVPHYELLTHFPLHYFAPEAFSSSSSSSAAAALNYSCLLVFLFNSNARGEATLQSADPAAPLRFDPKFLSTAFDRRAAVESLRDACRVVRHEAYARDSVAAIAAPAGESDEALLDYWRRRVGSSWHMTGTVRMGRAGDADAAVDADFRLVGFERLRVADMSVVPVIASCHVQCVAYLTGLTCAEKLIAEYKLA
ncbi:GMC oxidoreductase [Hypoxylon cercidicola]|nr:GMC oxidoreductase [Hypoxylon cercidicola]